MGDGNTTFLDLYKEYRRPFQSSWGTVLSIVHDPGFKTANYYPPVSSILSAEYDDLSHNQWICMSLACDELSGRLTEDGYLESYNARVRGPVIRNAYMSSTPERCELQFSLPFCWIFTDLNLLKGLLMLYIANGKFEDPPLTVGDTVASFLESPDPYTEFMCLATRKHFLKSRGLWETSPRAFTTQRKLLFSAARWGRWVFCLLLSLFLRNNLHRNEP